MEPGRVFTTRPRWGSPFFMADPLPGEPALEAQTCIDVGHVMEKIRRDKYVRQQKVAKQSDTISSDLSTWKKSNDANMKELKKQMAVLEKRKEQIRQSSMEMNFLADQLRQRIANLQTEKPTEEAMQT